TFGLFNNDAPGHVQKHCLFSKTVNEVPRTGKRSNLINFPFCLDLKKNNVIILVIKTVSVKRHEIFP
ncbi:hypothetical protein KFB82_27790, partial [Klebsiella pneumoniae]